MNPTKPLLHAASLTSPTGAIELRSPLQFASELDKAAFVSHLDLAASGSSWGSVTGSLSAQEDLAAALAGKVSLDDSYAEPTWLERVNASKVYVPFMEASFSTDDTLTNALSSINSVLDGKAASTYVDYAIQNVPYKATVRVATLVNGTLATAFRPGMTVDGVTLAIGDRILIKNQTLPKENGIYIVDPGSAPYRASDFNAWSKIRGAMVIVEAGTSNHTRAFLCTADKTGTIGTNDIPFTDVTLPKILAGLTTSAGSNVGIPLYTGSNSWSMLPSGITATEWGPVGLGQSISLVGWLAAAFDIIPGSMLICSPGSEEEEPSWTILDPSIGSIGQTLRLNEQKLPVWSGNWKIVTDTYSASPGDSLLLDSSGMSFTLNLPTDPRPGAEVSVADSRGTWGTHSITVSGNGNYIEGASAFLLDNTSNAHRFIWNGEEWKNRGN